MALQVKHGILAFALVFACAVFIGLTFHTLHNNFQDAEKRQNFVSSDSNHYLNGAREIISGDFSFKYIKQHPHREILYPAILAVPLLIFGENLYALGAVSILCYALAAVFAGIAVYRLFSCHLAAFFAAALLLFNQFTLFNSTYSLMTEGVFIAIAVSLLYFFIRYLQTHALSYLVGMSAICGLEQLVRPNGFFFLATCFLCIAVTMLMGKLTRLKTSSSDFPHLFKHMALAGLVFIVVSIPSWTPRVYYFNNPMYDGYLTNYLWADTYKQAHNAEDVYTFYDYYHSHNLVDVGKRLLRGLKKSYLDYPLNYMGAHVWLAMMLGTAVAIWRRRMDMIILSGALFITMAPIVWTVLSNPTPRIGFGLTLPFSAYLGGYAISLLTQCFTQRSQRCADCTAIGNTAPMAHEFRT